MAEDVVSMRCGAHEGEEIVRRMELALRCGLRPDCNAVTVAVESPEEKRKQQKTLQEQAPATESMIKELESSTSTVSPAAGSANNSETTTAARQHHNQRALDEKRKKCRRKRQGKISITQASLPRPKKATVRFQKGGMVEKRVRP